MTENASRALICRVCRNCGGVDAAPTSPARVYVELEEISRAALLWQIQRWDSYGVWGGAYDVDGIE